MKQILSEIRRLFDTDDPIYLHEPTFRGQEKDYLMECIDSTFVSSVGKFVDKFELDIAKYTGAKYAIVTVNGTAALQISLMLAGVKPQDEVITQALTFVSTANSIRYCGAEPIFIDVDRDTLGLSPTSLKNYLEKNTTQENGTCINKKSKRRISACVPMHTFGHPSKIDEIVSICEQHNINVVEDAAESLGSFYKNKHTGTFGKLGVLSFNGNKIITTGGGGMILTDDEELAKRAKHITTQAKVPHAWEYAHDEVGYNYRMPNINAALGCAQLESLPKYLVAKRKLASDYLAMCKELKLSLVSEPENAVSNYWLNAIIFDDRAMRNEFLEISNKNKIGTRPIWKLMTELEMYKNCDHDNLENSIWLADRVVNIPSSVI